MDDYSKIVGHLKVSEARCAIISQEIKDVEGEVKHLDDEIEIMRAKQKQLKEEISYKYKIVNEKKAELQSLTKRFEIWNAMHEEKTNIFYNKNEELEIMQQTVWDTRISFYDKTMEYLTKNDFLLNNDGFENIIKNQREKRKLVENIKSLENNLNAIESKHREIKGRHDLLLHLEKEKEILLEYEHNPDIIRLQTKIDCYNRELESLQLELEKYSDTASMHPQGTPLKQKFHHFSESRVSTSFKPNELKITFDEIQEEDFEYQEKKRPFKPKIPSFLLMEPAMEKNKE